MPLVTAYSRKLGHRSILARTGSFFEKRAPKILRLPPSPHTYSILFLSDLHRNKALYDFRKRGQRSIVERNISLEYSLLVASNSHISTTLCHLLWKNVNGSKIYVLTVPMMISFKVFRYFLSGKISFFLFAFLW